MKTEKPNEDGRLFNPDKLVLMEVNATVKAWIEELQKLPPETPVSVCGAYNGYIHVQDDENGIPEGITIDCEPLYECYPEGVFDEEE